VIDTLLVEATSGVVVDDVGYHGEAEDMADVDERLELIELAR